MIIEITALVTSIVALVAQVLMVREQNRKWDEYNKNSKRTISESNIVIENKIKKSILLKPKENCNCGQPLIGGYICQRTDCNQTFKSE